MQDSVNKLKVSGIVPVLPAPFLSDEELDLDSLRKLVRFCADSRFSAACIPAYASEFYKLSMEERYRLVAAAVEAAKGEIPVIAQSNHYSSKLAAEIVRENEALGASAVSIAVPRLFAISDDDIFQFLAGVLGATSLPVLVQDFNPGGPTISAPFVRRLHDEFPQFRYVKLEEPLMGHKVEQILDETGGAVEVLAGWGGMYLLEGIAAGICGAMPGLGIADLLEESFQLARSGDLEAAMDVFQEVLPHIVFSLQNLELFLYMEKQLLLRRNLIADPTVRSATLSVDAMIARHVDLLTERVLQSLKRQKQRRAAQAGGSQ